MKLTSLEIITPRNFSDIPCKKRVEISDESKVELTKNRESSAGESWDQYFKVLF
jgi:hypothetical protein